MAIVAPCTSVSTKGKEQALKIICLNNKNSIIFFVYLHYLLILCRVRVGWHGEALRV
jgi:hypothetical protein